MSEIPDFIDLTGDEDGNVTATCRHDSHDRGGGDYVRPIAFFGPPVSVSWIGYDVPEFRFGNVAGFVAAIVRHSKTHVGVGS